MTSTQKQTLLVTGASGHLGRRVVELLLDSYDGPIIATSRSPEKLADLTERGVTVRQADFDHADSLVKAFTGADRVLIISTDALAVPGHRLEQHKTAIAAAEKAGVKHVLYTSGTKMGEPGNPASVAVDHRGTEEAMAASSMDWTVLRNNLYMDLLLMSLPQAIASGQLVAASGDGGYGWVRREDCARAAAAALAADTTGRRTLEVTGPEVLTYDEVARITSDVSGKDVQYTSVNPEQMVEIMASAGLPAAIAESYVTMDTAAKEGYWAVATDVVEELTGKAPQSVREFLTANKAALLA